MKRNQDKRKDLLYRAISTVEEFKKRSLGKLTDAEGTTSAMDEVDYLQIYIHDFENWDGKTVPPSTFTRLTVNDVDVTELTLYDTLGSAHIIEVDTIPPEYPIMVVGINESMNFSSSLTDSSSSLGKITSGQTITISQIKLDRSAMDYEPWWKGKAELYFRVYDKEASDDDRWYVGYLSPDGDHKSYQCWKWKTWHYVQDKPWRTISLNTGWAYSSFADENRNFSLKLIEYDPLFYDLAENSMWWCLVPAVLAISPDITNIGSIVFTLATIGCVFDSNDDLIGSGDNFKTYISYAKACPGDEIIWDAGHFRIKIIVR